MAHRDLCGIGDGDDLNNALEAIFDLKYHPYVQSDYIKACITDAFVDSPTNVLLVPLGALSLAAITAAALASVMLISL